MEGIVVGFYLVMVSILPNGNVNGEVIDYFTDPLECIYNGCLLYTSDAADE